MAYVYSPGLRGGLLALRNNIDDLLRLAAYDPAYGCEGHPCAGNLPKGNGRTATTAEQAVAVASAAAFATNLALVESAIATLAE